MPDVEARQLTRENAGELFLWIEAGKQHIGVDGQVDGLSVFTPGGRMVASFGDWIIRSADGSFSVPGASEVRP